MASSGTMGGMALFVEWLGQIWMVSLWKPWGWEASWLLVEHVSGNVVRVLRVGHVVGLDVGRSGGGDNIVGPPRIAKKKSCRLFDNFLVDWIYFCDTCRIAEYFIDFLISCTNFYQIKISVPVYYKIGEYTDKFT